MNSTKAIRILYKNWRGEIAWRTIVPIKVWFGATQWHTEEQWLLKATDVDKNAERDFALNDIQSWGSNYKGKLVRDKIPAICRANGDVPKTRVLNDGQEYLTALIDKLFEEATEVKEKPSLEELADTLEVILSIGRALGYTPEEIEAARRQKAEERGGFDDRIFLFND